MILYPLLGARVFDSIDGCVVMTLMYRRLKVIIKTVNVSWITPPLLRCYLLTFIVLFLSACTAKLPQHTNFDPTFHLSNTASSTLYDLYQQLQPQGIDEKTGFALLNNNKLAFLARIAAIELADLSLDLQYYHWKNDEVGLFLMDRVISAADRGVKVRLLIDDSNSWGSQESQISLAKINHHPNITIKIYNPLGGSFSGSCMRTLALFGDFERVNHRMHNKLFIADNQLAIFGGRNIGNMYFGVGKKINFRDMDILALGQQVDNISVAFDDYWNSLWAYNINLIEQVDYSVAELKGAQQKLAQRIVNLKDFPYQIPSRQKLLTVLENLKQYLDWATLSVYADPPRKDLHEKSTHAYNRLISANLAAQEESITSSPYFIPTEQMIEKTKKLVEQGVSVKVLTNSLSSNDVTMAQYGYAARRKSLLAAGIELYELRDDALDRINYTAKQYRDTDIGLHAKVTVIDNKRVLIGSFNIDPRSTLINTEVVIVIESKALAKKVKLALLRDISPRNSYHVFLEEDNHGHEHLRWRNEEKGEIVIHKHEPNTNFLTVFGELLFSLLPVDDQL